MELKCRNVNDAFRSLVKVFNNTAEDVCGTYGVPIARKPYSNPNGSGVRIQIDEPVMIHYSHPKERVLFNGARDANPFFHLYESLWMLAGRNDVAPLAYYNSKVGSYSDDGETFNGAYGYRWRGSDNHYFVDDDSPNRGGYAQFDQLNFLIHHLRDKPESSRAVLAMWNVEDDLLKIDSSKDCCCNLDVVFSIREGPYNAPIGVPDNGANYLDMTVFNRSNDLIWGTLGANYVTFSVLQEYVAAHLGVEVGRYTQATTNLHVYDWNWKPEEWLKACDDPGWENWPEWYTRNQSTFTCVPLVKDPAAFDRELPLFVEWVRRRNETFADPDRRWIEPFLDTVARPMFLAFCAHKQKQPTALAWAAQITADDWRVAATNWLKKRVK